MARGANGRKAPTVPQALRRHHVGALTSGVGGAEGGHYGLQAPTAGSGLPASGGLREAEAEGQGTGEGGGRHGGDGVGGGDPTVGEEWLSVRVRNSDVHRTNVAPQQFVFFCLGQLPWKTAQ